MLKLKLFGCFLNLFCLINLSHQQYGTFHPPVPHPCSRQCMPDWRMICNYKFTFQNYYTMSKACFNCPYNITDCYRPQFIPGNGVTRPILTTNVLMPGPIISVCENDTIQVVVENQLMGSVTTIHWHGIFQNGTQYMDGVPYITQCPINPYSSFQYTFPVNQYGTYFWHSHSAFQIVDGLAGLLVIRTAPGVDPNEDQYDYDLDQHTIIASDFNNLTGLPLDGFHYQVLSDKLFAPSVIINGHGQGYEFDGGIYTPLEQFVVQAKYRYRFRFVNNVNIECPTVLSVDGHSLTVIAIDGNPVEPYTVPAFASGPGQRTDFVVNANHSGGGNFWMKFQGMGALPKCSMTYGAANLHYNGSVQIDLTQKYIPPLLALTFNQMLYDAQDLVSLTPGEYFFPGSKFVNVKLTFSVGANPNNDPLSFNLQYYPWDSFNSTYQLPLFLINGIYMKYPASPLLSQLEDVDPKLFCQFQSQDIKCKDIFCSCIHLLSFDLNKLIEIVLINTENDQGYHTFHLHGYAFRVVGQGYLPATNNTLKTFKDLDEQGKISRNFDRAPLRDGVIVNQGGYAIIRFKANNPGYWLFHCQMAYHFQAGMSMVLGVGQKYDVPIFPKDFPKCGNYEFDDFLPSYT